MVFGDVQNKHLLKTGIAQTIDIPCQRLLRLKEESIPTSEEAIMGSICEEGEYAPECKTWSSIDQFRRNGDECRIDFRIEENEEKII